MIRWEIICVQIIIVLLKDRLSKERNI